MLLICMSIAGSVPLVLCILLWMIKRKNFSYWLGRDLVLLSLAGYLIPFQLVIQHPHQPSRMHVPYFFINILHDLHLFLFS